MSTYSNIKKKTLVNIQNNLLCIYSSLNTMYVHILTKSRLGYDTHNNSKDENTQIETLVYQFSG